MYDFNENEDTNMDIESPWDDPFDQTHAQFPPNRTDELQLTFQEWSKLSDQFTNAGFREGITAGKEGSLQEGFDDGFANVGVPLGRQVGLLRGVVAGLLAALSSSSSSSNAQTSYLANSRQGVDNDSAAIADIREISRLLAQLRFSDIEPRDIEAEAHAREHLADSQDTLVNENENGNRAIDNDAMDLADLPDEVKERKEMDALEDALTAMTASDPGSAKTAAQIESTRPTMQDLVSWKIRLQRAISALGLPDMDL